MTHAVNEPGPLLAADDGMRAFIAQSDDLLVLTDERGTIAWSNDRLASSLGRASADLVGASLLQFAPAGEAGEATRRTLADACIASGLAPTDIHLGGAEGAEAIGVRARMQPAGRFLLWTLTDVTLRKRLAHESQRQRELLDMAQEFGRIGVWERELPSGRGRWDRHVFGFWGLDPANGTPSFEAAIEHIHPDDRAGMSYLESTHRAGRHKQHYRVVQADGGVRRIQSQWEVRVGPDGVPNRVVGIMMDDTEIFESARALDDANTQLKLAADLGNIVIWRHDLVAERMHYNERGFELLQQPYRPEGMLLEEVRSFIHPDDVATVADSAARTLATGQPTDAQARYRRTDGTWRDVMLRRVLERDAQGRPIAFVGVALDITEHLAHRRQADELAHRLEAASRAAGIGLWTSTLDPPSSEWNAQMFALFDRFEGPQAPSFGDWMRECVHPDDRDEMAGRFRAYLTTGEGPAEREFRILRRDGSVRWIALRADRDRAAGQRCIVGVAMDVTERHLALDALRDAAERSALITRHAGIGMWEAAVDGAPARWDEQMFRLRGMTPRANAPEREERVAIIHPDDVEHVIDSASSRTVLEGSGSYEFRIRLPDGSWRWLASRSVLVRDDDGRPVRRVGMNWDFTEIKNIELARQQSIVAERELQAKSQFLSRMSHELRTPLNAVLGFTQLLQIEARQSAHPSQLAMLGHVRAAGDHLLSLINDALDLSGLEAGELKLTLQAVDLAALARQSIPLVESLATQQGVMVEIDAASHGVATADPTRLRQVLINLLSNAIKYNRPHGRVLVRIHGEDERVVLSVRDTGRGLSVEQQGRLFEPFNRFGAENEGIEGTGIGLTIVKALVEGMGGTIDVTSRVGVGTTVEVRLAASRQAPVASTPSTPARPYETQPGELPHARSGQILYIEDNPVNVLLVEELVKSVSGLRIASEATGLGGTQRARTLRPDLVLIDLQLPDFDGFEVLRRLRADPLTRAIPCIALSANAMPDDIERGLAAGFADYWTKPIDFAKFLASLKRIFPGEPIRERV